MQSSFSHTYKIGIKIGNSEALRREKSSNKMLICKFFSVPVPLDIWLSLVKTRNYSFKLNLN